MTDAQQPNPADEKQPPLDFNDDPIEAGNVVCLLHDPMLMTVEFADDTDRSNIVSCVWFDADGHLQRGNFVSKTLICCDEVELEAEGEDRPPLDS